jgi:tRNA A37 threonylcarbamoyladenosine dehydratase
MVLCTGGKDSTYLLWLLAKKLGLRVLAAAWNMPYTNDTCRNNLRRSIQQLPSVELIERFRHSQGKGDAFAGLGGVVGRAFLALVRCGASRFRLAENGVFDPPDMSRQAAAFGSTMDRPKLDVYIELARSITAGGADKKKRVQELLIRNYG